MIQTLSLSNQITVTEIQILLINSAYSFVALDPCSPWGVTPLREASPGVTPRRDAPPGVTPRRDAPLGVIPQGQLLSSLYVAVQGEP